MSFEILPKEIVTEIMFISELSAIRTIVSLNKYFNGFEMNWKKYIIQRTGCNRDILKYKTYARGIEFMRLYGKYIVNVPIEKVNRCLVLFITLTRMRLRDTLGSSENENRKYHITIFQESPKEYKYAMSRFRPCRKDEDCPLFFAEETFNEITSGILTKYHLLEDVDKIFRDYILQNDFSEVEKSVINSGYYSDFGLNIDIRRQLKDYNVV